MKTGPPSFAYVVAAALLGSALTRTQATGPTELPADQCQPSDHWNALASDGVEYVAADTFSPQADGAVSQVIWSGTYLSGSDPCDPGGADAFEIAYYDDAGGYPGSILAGPFAQAQGTLTVTGPTATGDVLLDDIPEYTYQATHAPVPVLAGQCYWLEIRNPRGEACAWYWTVAEAADGFAIHERRAGEIPGDYDPLDLLAGDLAFCLDVALEPASSCGVPPDNDACADRFTLAEGPNPFSTIAATGTHFIDPYALCQMSVGDEPVHRDVWFEYTPPCTAMLRLDVCEADFDTKIAVLEAVEGCPDPHYDMWPIVCNDDACGHEPTALDEICYTGYPYYDRRPCQPWLCRAQLAAFDPNCRYWPWPPECDTLAEALCRKPAAPQSDIALPVVQGRSYLISVGGYSSDGVRAALNRPECRVRICRVDPRCCDNATDWFCELLAYDLCLGRAGSGTLNVDLVATPPVSADLRRFHDFLGCFTGPCPSPPCDPATYPDPCCLNQDFDNDGDIDTDDYAHHLAPALTGP
jgi:hypothetical protein